MSKFPKTVAAVQKHDRSQWEIGDALLAETDIGGSYDELEEVAAELEGLNIEGYSVTHLSNLRRTAHNFPPIGRSNRLLAGFNLL